MKNAKVTLPKKIKMLIPSNPADRILISKVALEIAKNECEDYCDVSESYDAFDAANSGDGYMQKCISCAMRIYNIFQK